MKQFSPPNCLGLVFSTVMGIKTRTSGEIVQRAKGLAAQARGPGFESSNLCRSYNGT